MNRFFFLMTILFSVSFSSCSREEDLITEGYKPIYIEKSAINTVRSGGPEPLVNPGKIYLYNTLVFVNERGRGVHVVNNATPSSPVKTHFIHIPGNYDVAIRNNMMYADNASDLITLDISDLTNIQVKNRIQGVYSVERQMYPDFATGYFECADTTKGFVVGWTKTELVNPKCFR